ncbi:DNA ligase (NAD(+)) LigA, partial [Leptospira borgpetersenii serovar Hardjo-bovis]|uniref:helix-hairpin-helix domain-containing protein n=1 Tax=Leptospira borgpetersenii TaxID=174 RepID=UPI0019FFBDF7
IEFLYDHGYIRCIAALYDLQDQKENLIDEEGFGETSLAIISNGIEQSKQKDFRFLLPSLGLSELGHKVTELLIEHGIDSIDEILSIAKDQKKIESLLEIPGIGPSTIQAFQENFSDKRILKLIERLKKAGLKMKADPIQVADQQPFAGQSWCVTGSFENFQPRDKAMDLI